MIQTKGWFSIVLIGILSISGVVFAQTSESRYLLLDSRNIQSSSEVKLVLGPIKKHPDNPLYDKSDMPWVHEDETFDNFYGNIIYEKGRKYPYRMWHHTFGNDFEWGLLYAESKDGLHWIKPNLGLVEWEGSTKNNIIMTGKHGIGVMLDERDPDPSRRYKLVGGTPNQEAGMDIGFSSDGYHWKLKSMNNDIEADTHNQIFWAPTLEKYVMFVRTWGDGGRAVGRLESTDFINWSPMKLVYENTSIDQTYAMPVFYYAGIYIGLCNMFRDRSDTDERVDGTVTPELVWSPDTVKWHGICEGTPFIPLGADYESEMVWSTCAPLFLDQDEVRIYYAGSDGKHGWDRNIVMCLATMKKDRWAGYQASDTGTVETKPVSVGSKDLVINADVQKGGSVRVEVVGKGALSLDKCNPITADVIDGKVSWSGASLSALVGTRIGLRFKITNATLYSFAFAD